MEKNMLHAEKLQSMEKHVKSWNIAMYGKTCYNVLQAKTLEMLPSWSIVKYEKTCCNLKRCQVWKNMFQSYKSKHCEVWKNMLHLKPQVWKTCYKMKHWHIVKYAQNVSYGERKTIFRSPLPGKGREREADQRQRGAELWSQSWGTWATAGATSRNWPKTEWCGGPSSLP